MANRFLTPWCSVGYPFITWNPAVLLSLLVLDILCSYHYSEPFCRISCAPIITRNPSVGYPVLLSLLGTLLSDILCSYHYSEPFCRISCAPIITRNSSVGYPCAPIITRNPSVGFSGCIWPYHYGVKSKLILSLYWSFRNPSVGYPVLLFTRTLRGSLGAYGLIMV